VSAFFLAQILNENDSHLRRKYRKTGKNASNFFQKKKINLAMFVCFDDKITA
tara:strand:+ start:1190 stop:1345 length:156 start_codon:yes stop_codon:yes gene_type:complete